MIVYPLMIFASSNPCKAPSLAAGNCSCGGGEGGGCSCEGRVSGQGGGGSRAGPALYVFSLLGHHYASSLAGLVRG
jgi:hypothetical protein